MEWWVTTAVLVCGLIVAIIWLRRRLDAMQLEAYVKAMRQAHDLSPTPDSFMSWAPVETNKGLTYLYPIWIVFDGPPGPKAGRFVEIEDASGKSIKVGEWLEREGGLWALRIEGVAL